MVDIVEVGFGVERLDVDALGCVPGEIGHLAAPQLLRSGLGPVVDRRVVGHRGDATEPQPPAKAEPVSADVVRYVRFVMQRPGGLFEFDDVEVSFGDARALDGISLTVPDDGVTVLLGASGSGKSTMLRLCNRLEVPTAGRVLFRGTDIMDLDPLSLRRRVGMVFQRPTLFPGTVIENLRVASA